MECSEREDEKHSLTLYKNELFLVHVTFFLVFVYLLFLFTIYLDYFSRRSPGGTVSLPRAAYAGVGAGGQRVPAVQVRPCRYVRQ